MPKGSTKITTVRIKNTKAKTIKASTIKSAHNTGHFSLGEQITQ